MALRPKADIPNDFSRVLEILKDRRVVPQDAGEDMLGHARAIHRKTYSLIIWRFRLTEISPSGQAFLDEIASDAIQILPQVMLGYSKSTKLLIRGIIENALRHVYFSDHLVDFIRLNRDRKWYVNVESLFEYARNHHHFRLTEPRFDALARLSSTYDQLSAGVHGRTVFDLEMRTALEGFKYQPDRAAIDIDLLNLCTSSIIFLLSIFHHEQFNRSILVIDDCY